MQHKTLLFSRISYLIAGFFFLNTAVSIAQSIQKAAFVSTSSGVGLDLRLRNKKGVPDFAAGINSGSAFINMGTHYALDAKVLFGKTHSFLLGFNLNAATDDYITVRRYADGEPFIAQRFLYNTHLSPLLGYRYQSAQKRVFVEGFVSPIGFEIASNKPYLREFSLGVPLFDLRLGFNMDRMDENGDKIANSAYFDADTSRKISVQHSIYLQNPILLGYDVRVHGLWRHDLAFTLNGFKSFGENFNDFTNANLSATVLLGKGNTPV
jgi:hypothetical protein